MHLVAAILVSLVNFHENKTPPTILEVVLAGGGGGGAASSTSTGSTEINAPASKNDIVDKKLTPEQQKEKKQEKASENNSNNNSTSDNNNSTGSDTGKGSGSGSGEGSGSGSGSGSGNGDGNGSGNGSGSGMETPAVPPRLASRTNPRYPASARSAGITGVARVRMLVNASGRVDSAELYGSSGNGELDASAVECVYKWRFTPAKNGAGKPVPCYIIIPVRFSLN